MSDTIAAIATGNVLSAIGILRLSGDGVLTVIDRVFRPANGRPMSEAPDRKLVYGAFCDTDGQTLDLCLCTVSRAPHSYTGEDTAELQCHGSPAVLRAGLQALFAAGARQALAGEFTKRAFLNGRMDLTQAEAVIDLIDAQSAAAAKNAAAQLDGGLRRRLEPVQEALIDITSRFYAVVDYPDEDIEDIQPQQIRSYLQIEEPAEISVQVYDLNGKLLVSKNYGKCESGIIAIPISSLQPGNYLLNINKDGKSDVAKLIIK